MMHRNFQNLNANLTEMAQPYIVTIIATIKPTHHQHSVPFVPSQIYTECTNRRFPILPSATNGHQRRTRIACPVHNRPQKATESTNNSQVDSSRERPAFQSIQYSNQTFNAAATHYQFKVQLKLIELTDNTARSLSPPPGVPSLDHTGTQPGNGLSVDVPSNNSKRCCYLHFKNLFALYLLLLTP